MVFQGAALLLLTVFYGSYFVKMFAQRKKGIQTDQLGKGKTGFVKLIEAALKAASWAAVFTEVVSIFWGLSLFPDLVRVAGLCLGTAGTIFFLVSVCTMRDSWRAGVPDAARTELVTSGVYRFSRNPAFLGFDLLYLGILLMFFNYILLVVSLLAIVMLHLQIVNVEEDFLAAAFGEEYLNYKKQVCRYLGRK